MCCTSLQVSKGLQRPNRGRRECRSVPVHSSWVGLCVGGRAYLASRVRAMTPAAMEAEREVPGCARVQPRSGPRVTCRGRHDSSVSNSIYRQSFAKLSSSQQCTEASDVGIKNTLTPSPPSGTRKRTKKPFNKDLRKCEGPIFKSLHCISQSWPIFDITTVFCTSHKI